MATPARHLRSSAVRRLMLAGSVFDVRGNGVLLAGATFEVAAQFVRLGAGLVAHDAVALTREDGGGLLYIPAEDEWATCIGAHMTVFVEPSPSGNTAVHALGPRQSWHRLLSAQTGLVEATDLDLLSDLADRTSSYVMQLGTSGRARVEAVERAVALAGLRLDPLTR